MDSRQPDLLGTWQAVDDAWAPAFDEAFRLRYPDSAGRGLAYSHFFVSWSGFRTNPVQRPFGWHTCYDHFRESFGPQMARWNDEQYWMYNHPSPTGIGNEWGLVWEDNTHYFEILNHMVIDRAYFPVAIQVPTERNDCSHFIEQWFPFDYGNRNAASVVLNSINSDGRKTGEVMDWTVSPYDWSSYRPQEDDYRRPDGTMNHTKFRIVDIKSICNVLTREDLQQAFERCRAGLDTIVCAYEHDFRDRKETIMELMIAPIFDLARSYPEVEIHYANARTAARATLGLDADTQPPIRLELAAHEREGLRIATSRAPFGPMPYVVVYDPAAESYVHLPVARTGQFTWRLPAIPLPPNAVIGIAANDRAGNTAVRRWQLDAAGKVPVRELPEDERPNPGVI
ncbi:MAG TPA: hypothetical protein VK196_18480 [Magnetospirillum sp.]|nr:hypothetical protein [Magnetospirillum sp.]